MSEAGADGPEAGPAVEALRALGAQQRDPVRFAHLEALARRAATHQGEIRHLLDRRLVQLLAAWRQDLGEHPITAAAQPAPAPRQGALADLLTHIARHAAAPGDSVSAGNGLPNPRAPAELKAVQLYRSTWSRLSVDRRLTQSLSQVPDNAGPLNTQRLLHQALTVMRAASPAYLHRFMSQVEALLWLNPTVPPSAVAKQAPARGGRDRKSAGTRPG